MACGGCRQPVGLRSFHIYLDCFPCVQAWLPPGVDVSFSVCPGVWGLFVVFYYLPFCHINQAGIRFVCLALICQLIVMQLAYLPRRYQALTGISGVGSLCLRDFRN